MLQQVAVLVSSSVLPVPLGPAVVALHVVSVQELAPCLADLHRPWNASPEDHV